MTVTKFFLKEWHASIIHAQKDQECVNVVNFDFMLTLIIAVFMRPFPTRTECSHSHSGLLNASTP